MQSPQLGGVFVTPSSYSSPTLAQWERFVCGVMQARSGGELGEFTRHRDRPQQLGGVLVAEQPSLKPELARGLPKADLAEPVVLDADKRATGRRKRAPRGRGALHVCLRILCPIRIC